MAPFLWVLWTWRIDVGVERICVVGFDDGDGSRAIVGDGGEKEIIVFGKDTKPSDNIFLTRNSGAKMEFLRVTKSRDVIDGTGLRLNFDSEILILWQIILTL